MNTPRAGSVANAWTEVSTPERTRKVPSRRQRKRQMASSTVQLLNAPRFSVTASEWISAVPVSHGMNDAFSTGSQNHQPPQPRCSTPIRCRARCRREEGPRDSRPRPRPARPRGVEHGRRSARRWRKQTPPRNRHSPCRASADETPCPGPAAADSGRGLRRRPAAVARTGST